MSEIDRIVREDDDIEKALDIGDKEVLVGMLGLDQEICDQCRTIWKKCREDDWEEDELLLFLQGCALWME